MGGLGAVKTVAGEPMFLLLLAAAGCTLAVRDLGEGLLLGFFAVVSVGLVITSSTGAKRPWTRCARWPSRRRA